MGCGIDPSTPSTPVYSTVYGVRVYVPQYSPIGISQDFWWPSTPGGRDDYLAYLAMFDQFPQPHVDLGAVNLTLNSYLLAPWLTSLNNGRETDISQWQ